MRGPFHGTGHWRPPWPQRWVMLAQLSRLVLSALVFLAAGAAPLAVAQGLRSYPAQRITMVVPFAAGGPTDTVARDLAEAMGKRLHGQALVIENVAGAGGTLGAAKVAKAPPDGYTLLLHHIGMATAPALFQNLSYDVMRDFEFLGLVNEVPMTLIGRSTLPARNFAELRRWLGDNRGRINLATAGLGAASHLCGLLLQQRLGLRMSTVPYKGTAPAMADLLDGQVDLMCDQTTNTTGQIAAGQVRAYAVTTARRLSTAALAQLPTLDEAGLKGFNVSIWHGLYAPKGTPPEVVEALNAALRAALADPEFVRRETALGAAVVQGPRSTPAGHRAFVAAETVRWAPTIRAAGQLPD